MRQDNFIAKKSGSNQKKGKFVGFELNIYLERILYEEESDLNGRYWNSKFHLDNLLTKIGPTGKILGRGSESKCRVLCAVSL